MSVAPRRYRKDRSPAKVAPSVVAADLLKAGATPLNGEINPQHPLAGAFTAFLGDNIPTKRQAAKFLQKYPTLRGAVKAA